MHTIRRHAEELAAHPWATLGIKVPEAQRIVDQVDLMNDRLDRLRAAETLASTRAAIHADTLLVIHDLVDREPDDSTVRDAIRNAIQAGRDKIDRLRRSDTRPNASGGEVR